MNNPFLGWEGTDCEIDINECIGDVCQNGGTCKEVENDYLCECQSSYEGKNCEIGKHILKVISLGGLRNLIVFLLPFFFFKYTAKIGPECRDQNTACASWEQLGYCNGIYEDYMKSNCIKSCKVCDGK